MEARARAMDRLASVAPSAPPVGVAPPLDLRSLIPAPRDPLPGFGAAMVARVRFAGGEVPLWSLITPLILVAALSAALAAAAVSEGRKVEQPVPSSSAEVATMSSGSSVVGASPSAEPNGVPSGAPAAPRHAEPADLRPLDVSELPPARSGTIASPNEDFEAAPEKYSAEELLAFAESRSRSLLVSARELESALDRDPGLIQEQKTKSDLRRLSENPETARIVFGAVANLPAPVAADILYELWTGTVEKTESTELARTLLYSRDVRSKASPALSVALDLRVVERCEDVKAILPRAIREGDRRSLHLAIKLQRKYGCGPNKRQDCYPCLRKGDELESTIKAVKARPEPKTLAGR